MKNKFNKKIALEIVAMATEDQRLRKTIKNNDWKKIEKADAKHARNLFNIINQYGWPTIFRAKKKASLSAWLIVQHSDLNIPFQKRCLRLMKRELSKNPRSIKKMHIAYLTDRVLVNTGRKQKFGTQFKRNIDGTLMLRPLVDEEKVHKWRKEFGLKPLKKYLAQAVKSGK